MPMTSQIVEKKSHNMKGADHRARYQGKQLFSLMLAMCVPAALLYIRLVLGLAASEMPVTPAQANALNRWAVVALTLFFVAQFVAARYVQRMLPRPSGRVRDALQYVGVLLMCLLFSLTGAIVLEAFGWNLFLRVVR